MEPKKARLSRKDSPTKVKLDKGTVQSVKLLLPRWGLKGRLGYLEVGCIGNFTTHSTGEAAKRYCTINVLLWTSFRHLKNSVALYLEYFN